MPIGFGKGGGRGKGGGGGRNAGHRGRGHRFIDRKPENCICPSCGIIALHQPGTPCFQTTCPSCGTAMTRQFGTPAISNEQRQTSINRAIPVINIDLCTGCGQCIDVCPVDAISIVNRKAIIDESRCNGCHACVSACPKSAIV